MIGSIAALSLFLVACANLAGKQGVSLPLPLPPLALLLASCLAVCLERLAAMGPLLPVRGMSEEARGMLPPPSYVTRDFDVFNHRARRRGKKGVEGGA